MYVLLIDIELEDYETLIAALNSQTQYILYTPSSDTYDSVTKKIFNFPDSTIVYPGHNYNGFTCSTIKEEKASNPNVGLHVSKEEFIESESKKERPYPKRFDVAVPANMNCGKTE